MTAKETRANTLEKYEIMFNGKLGRYPHEKFHLELVEGAKPVFKRAYSVPYKHKTVFKKELDSLVADGVLEKCGRSSWVFRSNL